MVSSGVVPKFCWTDRVPTLPFGNTFAVPRRASVHALPERLLCKRNWARPLQTLRTWYGVAVGPGHLAVGCSGAFQHNGHSLLIVITPVVVRVCLAPGYFTSCNGTAQCLPCAAGFFAEDEGKQLCDACPIGSHTNMTGQTSCELCPTGTANNAVGQEECFECKPGQCVV